jgi:poly(hydroxyalkanoate) depolymerase family esterase
MAAGAAPFARSCNIASQHLLCNAASVTVTGSAGASLAAPPQGGWFDNKEQIMAGRRKGLRDTLARLAQLRRRWDGLFALQDQSQATEPGPGSAGRLREVMGFGSNPGRLRMFAYVPNRLPRASALVVALHGCTQSAAGYDHGSGWSTLAERHGFALLCPEQQRANNPNTCFTWFHPAHRERARGEAFSIWQMIERMLGDYGIDRSRVFIVGLSAGGAMTTAMLAAYPEVFAGGAIIAGLPYGSASTVQDALHIMARGASRSPEEWGDFVRSASSHRGPWPKISVWHGSADNIVNPGNAQEIVKQWTNVHGLATEPNGVERVCGHERRVWRNAAGVDVIETYIISGLGHGVPLARGKGAEQCGHAGPFHVDVGLSSSLRIATFWGIAANRARASDAAAATPAIPLPVPDKILVNAKTALPDRSSPTQRPEQRRKPSVGADAGCSNAQGDALDPTDVVAAVLHKMGLLIPAGSKPTSDPRSIISNTLRAVGLIKK